MRLDVQKAVELARQYLIDVIVQDVLPPIPGAIRLEEVEISENDEFWLITLSYPDSMIEDSDLHPESQALRVLTGRENRVYKVVKLNADTGKLVSIKIRSLAAA